MHWVQMAGEAVATYYGRYPVPHLELRISPFDGRGVRHGMTWGRDGGGSDQDRRRNGNDTREGSAQDWMLTHEMVHLAFPIDGRRAPLDRRRAFRPTSSQSLAYRLGK